MKNYYALLICLIIYFPPLHAQNETSTGSGDVEVIIKRGKGFFGGAVKWPVSVVSDVNMRELGIFKQGKPIRRNLIGKINRMEYVSVNIPAEKESYIAIGSYYFYVNGEASSRLEINVAGLEYSAASCKGNVKLSAGFHSPDIILYRNWYEELDMKGDGQCEQNDSGLEGYTQMTTKR